MDLSFRKYSSEMVLRNVNLWTSKKVFVVSTYIMSKKGAWVPSVLLDARSKMVSENDIPDVKGFHFVVFLGITAFCLFQIRKSDKIIPTASSSAQTSMLHSKIIETEQAWDNVWKWMNMRTEIDPFQISWKLPVL